MGQAVRPLADPVALHSHTDKLRRPDSEWQRIGQAERRVAPQGPIFALRETRTNGGEWSRPRNPGLQHGQIKPQTSDWKTCGGWAAAGETPSLTGEVVGETHRGLEWARTHPLGNEHQKGPIWLWVAEGVTEIQQTVERRHCSLSAPPPRTASQRSDQRYPALGTPKALPL